MKPQDIKKAQKSLKQAASLVGRTRKAVITEFSTFNGEVIGSLVAETAESVLRLDGQLALVQSLILQLDGAIDALTD